MLKDGMKVRGEVQLVLTDAAGNVKETRTHNLVVNVGLAFITSRMLGTSANVISHMAVGTGATAAAGSQTALTSEAARVALTSASQVTTTIANDSAQYVATFDPGVGTAAIVEVGLFNASSGGTMVARSVFAVINKGASDTLTMTWKIVQAAA